MGSTGVNLASSVVLKGVRPHLGLGRAVSTLRPPLSHACASISGSCTPCFVSASARPRSSGGPLRPSAYTTW